MLGILVYYKWALLDSDHYFKIVIKYDDFSCSFLQSNLSISTAKNIISRNSMSIKVS